MPYRFFTIPIHDSGAATEVLNQFLASHKIASERTEFVQDGFNSAWVVAVSYVEHEGRSMAVSQKKSKIDYREVLSEGDFQIYAKLRSLRKRVADQEGVPPYALFNNQQLATMVERRVTTLSALQEIEGVGEARIKKYGESFLLLLRQEVSGLGDRTGGDDSHEA